jgi:hypothetical protein
MERKPDLDRKFKATVVQLILDGKTEEALDALSKEYGKSTPLLKVGLPKKSKKAFGCYDGRKKQISVRDSEILKNPFIILHEFYHHLRTGWDAKHQGTEKHADAFARDFLDAYQTPVRERIIGRQ